MLNRELLVLRHGKSDWDANASDFERPLKDRGKRGAQRIGVWLWQQDLRPQYIVTSPAERALVTAQKAAKAMGLDTSLLHTDQRVYEANLGSLLAVLGDCPADVHRVMVVGHNPGLEWLLEHLTGGEAIPGSDGKLLPTATVARLAMPRDWHTLAEGCAELLTVQRGRGLPKKFPFPAPDGSERRDRPAYYYTQSAVIPYRYRDGQLEVLVISSSKNHHLGVPKGIKEPGLSLQESAASEAWEEAGVEGVVGDRLLGEYTVDKWGGVCTVATYAMEVTRVLEDQHWDESHRQRQWMPPAQAGEQVRSPGLAALLADFEQTLKVKP